MNLHSIDLAIIIVYVVAVVIAGLVLSKRASRNLDSYFLGGKSVPWYMLGISNASSMFDIAGTMWLVSIMFIYGLKLPWILWLWPFFNQVFSMIYMSKWVRRSDVLTGGEWMETRFSKGRGLELSRISVLVIALVSTIGFLSYAFQGVGKFASVFFPFAISPEMYALGIMSITTVYVVAGGMYSVVFTDVIQFVLLTIISVVIGIIAMDKVSPEMISAIVPSGWGDFTFGTRLNLDWSQSLPAVNERIAGDGWEFFTIIVMAFLFKGILISGAGPTPGYDMQRSLAAKSPKEAGMVSAIVTLCTVPRWFMIGGIAILALAFYMPEMQAQGDNLDFELILPWVINEYVPVGLMGLLLAGLLAAF